MSSIPQNHSDEKALIDCVQRFFSKHHIARLLARCNGMKEKGVSLVSLLHYKLGNIFVGRSMYMQQRTGLLLSVQIQPLQKKKSSAFMANAGRLKFSSKPVNLC